MTFGLTPEGLSVKTLPQIRAELEARFRAQFGTSLPLGDQTLEGQIIGIYAEREAIVHELLEILFGMFDPDKASGAALRALCLLTGTFPPPPRPSTATLVLSGDEDTVVDAGSQVGVESVGDPTIIFQTLEDATLATADGWVTATPYEIGDAITVGVAPAVILIATESGTSGASSPSPINNYNDDNIQWALVGEGDSFAAVESASLSNGPFEAPALTLNEIVTPISGWSGALNAEDAILGNVAMTDADLRILREVELNRPGVSTLAGIRSALIELSGVTVVEVFENNTDATVDGMPPHSVEALLIGGDDADIAQTLFETVAAGIVTTGSEDETVTDDEGVDHTIKFSRPSEVPIYLDITLTKDPRFYPDNGDDQVKEAIATYGLEENEMGRDAVASKLIQVIFDGVPGVLDVSALLLDDAPSPGSSATVVIAARELATYDTANIAVTSSDGTP